MQYKAKASNGDEVELCTATQGVATLTLFIRQTEHEFEYDCDYINSSTDDGYSGGELQIPAQYRGAWCKMLNHPYFTPVAPGACKGTWLTITANRYNADDKRCTLADATLGDDGLVVRLSCRGETIGRRLVIEGRGTRLYVEAVP